MGPPGLKDTAGHKTETDLQPLGNTRGFFFSEQQGTIEVQCYK